MKLCAALTGKLGCALKVEWPNQFTAERAQ